MKLETFFEKFELFADAPNAVAKMRELVLGLAVRGKLVDQDPNDEPASELLKQIYAAKSNRRFCAESGEDPTASSDSYPFVIPNSWQWVGATTPAKIISDVGKKIQTKDALPEGIYPVVDQGKVFIRGYCDDHEKVIKVSEPIVLFGDHTRATKLIDFDFVVGADGVKLLQPLCIDPLYYFLALRWLPLDSRGYGRHFKLLRASVIPLPPLAEQPRIVAKVDELMALCDRLETQQQERDTQHAKLARASLACFADAPTPANLNLLFHPSYAVTPTDLRKTILTLAVQGKLVPQDPNDEPAGKLVSEIAEIRHQLVKDGNIRSHTISASPNEQDLPFSVPDSWQWIRLGLAVSLLGGYAYPSSAYVSRSSNQIIRLGNVKNDDLRLDQKPTYIPDSLAEETAAFEIHVNDILVTMTGTKAKRDYAFTLIVRPDQVQTNRLFLNQRVGAIRPFRKDFIPLINLFLKSDELLDMVFATATGTANQANIGTASILDLPFPLPPLAEQRRIVARVDQLMALVDQLETQLAASRTAAINLMEAVVAELTAQE